MTSVSSSKSPTLGAPSSQSSSRRGSDTHRIISAFALGRPEPYGKIPLRRPSGSRTNLLAQSSISPPADVNLSGIEGFDYDESWSLGIHPFLTTGKGNQTVQESDFRGDSSPSSPTEADSEERQGRNGKSISRTSTISSRRSSRESGRRPSLLQQSISPPIATSQSVSATGQASSSPRTSKSLAEKGGLSFIPSLYGASRGRSANVKLGGNWIERRGTSASVLVAEDDPEQRAKLVDERRKEPKLHVEQRAENADKRRRRRRRKSSEGTDSALFSSEEDFSLSSEEEELHVASSATSRRSSIERDRRRGLKILLTPSIVRQGTSDEVVIGSTSLASTSEEGILSLNSPPDLLSFTDEEAESDINRSALLDRRRSSSGKRLLESSLRSNSSSHRAANRLEVIFAGLTPDGLSDPIQSITPIKSKESVNVDADPLLSSAIGSVSDLIDVDAVVWNDRRSSNPNTHADASKKERKQTVEEQEKERRVGFAAAYQNRLASLLWSSKRTSSIDAAKSEADPVVDTSSASATQTNSVPSGDGDSLLTSSWKRLIQLPNLLLMPTLGPSRASALHSEEVRSMEDKRAEGVSGTDEATAALLLSMPPSPGASIILPPSPILSPSTPKEKGGRGVMNPLEGDSDVSAYVSGLGLPIDPDLELSSVVHLQTFRTTQAPHSASPSRSRRGSLEKPIPGDAHSHRRAFSDNKMEPPSPTLKLDKKLSDELRKKKDELEGVKKGADIQRKQVKGSTRGCSRPAVQAPVPGNFSAYNSSDSEGEDSSQKSSSDENRSRRAPKRGRTSGGRRRSCSPPMPTRKQCAIGLFESRTHSRSRTSEIDLAADHAAANMMRVRSTPNLPSLTATREKRQDRTRRSNNAAGGRGRGGSVKVVSASVAGEEEAMQEDVKAITALPNLLPIPPVSLHPVTSPSQRSPLGLGLPSTHGEMTAVRPSMVSNGAHLLMLSLELEMMRHRKITCSLKPRWLKARVRSDSGLNRLGVGAVNSKEQVGPRVFSLANARPKEGSSLRFEVV